MQGAFVIHLFSNGTDVAWLLMQGTFSIHHVFSVTRVASDAGNFQPLRACLLVFVSQPCARLYYWARECAALSRVVLHVAYLVPQGDERRTSHAQVPPPWVRHRWASRLVYRQALLSGPIFRRTLCRRRVREDVVVWMRHVKASLLFP